MIAVVDYGVGNLFSLYSSFKKVGADVVVTADKQKLQDADRILLPGVGAFEDAIKKLRESGLDHVLEMERQKGKYLMGICLGMQMLFEKSYEYGEHEGLGILKGEVVPMRDVVDDKLKIPHIGWNALHFTRPHFLFKDVQEGAFVYFVHSYFASNCQDSLLATMEYGAQLTASVAKDNVLGCQFHPEKSGEVGLNVLRAFCNAKD
ncbi:MAG: imidazole glycerol phosphate synthase subunit HisH [Clostridia bacterium]|nr:imidazole glycerol phosphate synthase subunit HisH [Clostridia bacterium]